MKKHYLISFAALCIFSALYLVSCNKANDEVLPINPLPIDLTNDQIALIGSENTFALDIFKKINADSDPSENIIISPLSLSIALSMTLNGADGSTRDAIQEALYLNGFTPEAINNAYKDLSKAFLTVDKRVLISIANSVWTEQTFEVKKPFIDILTDYYEAESKSFDITDPQTPVYINNWISTNTNGLIKEMINKLDDNAVMLLINAIYFKGKWNSQFDTKDTENNSFTKSDGSSIDVQMMKQTSDFKTYRGDGFYIGEFPYGQGNFVMDVILPDSPDNMENTISLLTNDNLNSWINELREIEVNLSFPKFKYGYKLELKDILSSMGMTLAFTDLADFSNISDLDLLITRVIHQAFIETNEEGTEAAAATVVEIGSTSAGPYQFDFKMDHPFLYMIRETTTNTILFIGKVNNPLLE